MTVCIATICHSSTTIFGACDRMITSGDIEFEPEIPLASLPIGLQDSRVQQRNPKIFFPTDFVAIMTAGDTAMQREVVAGAVPEIKERCQKRLQNNPNQFLPVLDVVKCYSNSYNAAKSNRVRDAVLIPLGLDFDTFISKQGEMNKEFISEVYVKMRRAELDFRETYSLETIVTGVDEDGPHIYTIVKSANEDHVTCADALGFAAIGVGSRHAESQFMMAGHTPFSNREETLLLTYMAKKRSEVAPGVGRETDMFVVGDGSNRIALLSDIPDFDMEKLNSFHKKMEADQKKAFRSAQGKTKEYIANMFAARAEKEPKLPAPPSNITSNEA